MAVDFFLVPTLTFRLLFVFVVLRHDRRELIHLNVTDIPRPLWTARQLIEAFPDDTAPKYLLRDRDAIYGEAFARRVERMGIREVLTAPRAPWQNPFVERVIGSIRRECLDHVLILNEAHLRRLLRAYVAYYNPRVPTKRSTTTVPGHARSNPRHAVVSSPSLRSAGSITATPASPDRGRPAGQPSPARVTTTLLTGMGIRTSVLGCLPAAILITPLTGPDVRAECQAISTLADEVSDRHRRSTGRSTAGSAKPSNGRSWAGDWVSSSSSR